MKFLNWNLKKINNTKQLDQKHEVILKCETINLPCTVVREAWFKGGESSSQFRWFTIAKIEL